MSAGPPVGRAGVSYIGTCLCSRSIFTTGSEWHKHPSFAYKLALVPILAMPMPTYLMAVFYMRKASTALASSFGIVSGT
jgi:hypothetical protein